jgi:hypothetical protein
MSKQWFPDRTHKIYFQSYIFILLMLGSICNAQTKCDVALEFPYVIITVFRQWINSEAFMQLDLRN